MTDEPGDLKEAVPAPARETADGTPTPEAVDTPPAREPRPWLERLGLAAVALVMAALFAVVAVAAGAGGEWILAAMSSVGALMTIAVAAITVVRG
ncbi:MAG TPA: hypothetical protein VE640_01440 [Candidatus Bathyarchaeia archaeon]|nr:hypothetical protein [Candidatus Bathyarchaeia archaeon]